MGFGGEGYPREPGGGCGFGAPRLHGAAVRTRAHLGAGSVRRVTLALCRTIWLLAAFALTGQSRDVVPLEAGMILDRSVTIRPGTYRLSAPEDLARPVITVRGEGITVDFNGAVRAKRSLHEQALDRRPVHSTPGLRS